jgi:Protein of unknown function (DUF3800)
MPDILDIACDESGHTGPDLLQKDQRYFAYASVAISDVEAYDIIQKVRAAHPVQMPELKARALMGSERDRRLIATLLTEIEGRYIVSINDKLLALCGWFFEYIYEPVYQDNPRLLYRKNLHRFIAMYTWLWMTDNESQARLAIEQFQRYMRSRNRGDAPFLFDNPRPPLTLEGTEHPFESILRFAYGYRDIIIADNARLDKELPDGGRWTLDLSTSGLWSHLNHWGVKGKLLSVRCDASKPLQANIKSFTGDENDPGIRRARENHSPERFGWRLLEPVAFVDSRDHPAIQLADVIAGAMVTIVANDFSPESRTVGEMIMRHVHPHSITPDMDVIDPSNRSAAVNALIVYDLAKRAQRHGDPYEHLAEMYHQAELSWVRGEFKAFQKNSGRD